MAEMHEDDYEWQPPSEAEMKIIQARRERSDKISKLMGDYLLKGYKMLGVCCRECNTILLQDKQGSNYCIACRELDTDVDKDDPVLNTDAARSQILEGSRTDPSDVEDDMSYLGRREQLSAPQQTPSPSQAQSQTNSQAPSQISSQIPSVAIKQEIPASVSSSASVTSSGVFSQSAVSTTTVMLNFADTVETLCGKIRWATEELKKSDSVEYSVSLCQMITSASTAIQSLKQASP